MVLGIDQVSMNCQSLMDFGRVEADVRVNLVELLKLVCNASKTL